MARTLRTTRALGAALALLVAATAGLVATTAAPASAAPSYGPWSSEVLGLSGRVSPPTAKQARAYAQVRRAAGSEGQRQARASYRIGGGKKVTLKARSLAPGSTTTFRTNKVPCGKSITVVAQGRYRASASSSWSPWYSVTATLERSC